MSADDCIFCRIVEGEIPSHTVYEDEHAYAFLDANPLAKGHTLLIPKSHVERLNDLDAEGAAEVFDVLPRLTDAVERAVDADGSTVAFNNGEAAGQEVPHVHCHVVPRHGGDGAGSMHTQFRDRPDLDDEQLAGVADSIDV